VTVFHGRLELSTGRLRYVDAGHGYCLIRRSGGEVERLAERSLPLGVGMGEVFGEGEVVLRPGDQLLVCSDGLAEVDEQPMEVEELAVDLDPAAGAAATVERLLQRVSGALADDVTVVVLNRLAAGSSAAAAARPAAVWGRPDVADRAPAAADGRSPVKGLASSRPAAASAPAQAASPQLLEEESWGRLFLRFLTIPGSSGGFYGLLVMATLIVFAEWKLGTGA